MRGRAGIAYLSQSLPESVIVERRLSSNLLDPATFSPQTDLAADDQIIVINSGALQTVGVDQVRELFTAGSNVSIDPNGVISVSLSGSLGSGSLATLSPIAALSAGDLVAVNQNGLDHSITYANVINGVTIDQAEAAGVASDSDTIWVGQATNIMSRQTLGALWPWIAAKLPLWKPSIIELTTNTTLTQTLHNSTVLVCSAPISISALPANLGSGFSCQVINLSSGTVTFSGNVITSTGSVALSTNQCGTMYSVSYSAGTVIFASMSADNSATVAPGKISDLVASSIGSESITLSWASPAPGGNVSTYSIQYRDSGTIPWTVAGQTNGSLNFAILELQPATSYDIAVFATNNAGSGPVSSALTVSTLASGVLPGAPTAVTISDITANGVSCMWSAPTSGGTTFVYTVQYSLSGQATWNSAASALSSTTVNIIGLTPGTPYDFQVIAANGNGSGPPSVPVTAATLGTTALVTSITWALAPSGSYAPGGGSIGVNAHVNPATAQVQFGFSTSATSPPTTWTQGVHVNTDFWGAYLSIPASPGTWYAWVEGSDGSAPTIYNTPFTVT